MSQDAWSNKTAALFDAVQDEPVPQDAHARLDARVAPLLNGAAPSPPSPAFVTSVPLGWAKVVSALAIAVAAGAAGYAWWVPPVQVVRVLNVPVPIMVEMPAAPADPVPVVHTVVAPRGAVPAPKAAAVMPATPPQQDAVPPAPKMRMAEERALLDVARAAQLRGNAALALEVVNRHETEFPDGLLAEEREAMAVQALVATGRMADARQRFEHFQAAYPRSMLRSTLLRAVRSDGGVSQE